MVGILDGADDGDSVGIATYYVEKKKKKKKLQKTNCQSEKRTECGQIAEILTNYFIRMCKRKKKKKTKTVKIKQTPKIAKICVVFPSKIAEISRDFLFKKISKKVLLFCFYSFIQHK